MGPRRSRKKRSTMPSRSNKAAKAEKTDGLPRQGQEKPKSISADTAAESEELKNLDSECKGKSQESHQIHNATNRPTDDENLSSRIAHSRKRSCSLSSDSAGDSNTAALNTRSKVITLIRARTLSRLSESDRPSEESLQALLEKKPSSSEERSHSEAPPDTMAFDKASIMDFVTDKKPRKKNKSKNKKGKKGNVPVEEQSGEPSKTGDRSASLPVCLQNTPAKLGAEEEATHGEPSDKTESECKGKGKGKQRVAVAVAVLESEASNKDVALPIAQPSPTKKKGDTDHAITKAPKTPELTAVKASTPSPSPQVSCKRASSMKETLPFIKKGKAQKGKISESPVFCASTPKSTGTASTSTGWTPTSNLGTQLSPQSTAASAPSTGHRSKSASIVSGQVVTYASSQEISSHAHPSSSSNPNIQQPPTQGGRTITSQKPEGFFWQLDSIGFPCAKQNCEKRCNLWDGAAVICPSCGPYSETRYCSREHLLEDVKSHWAICGQLVFQHPCRASTIPQSVKDGPPLIPCLHTYDTPERHRQAVYFNMNTHAGDYFIFSDWTDLVEARLPEQNLALRCSSRVVHVVKFTDPVEKDQFRRVLAASLFVTIESPQLTDYLFRLIRDNIRTTATGNTAHSAQALEASLKHQMFHEFAVTILPGITGEHHACPTDWTGRNRRTCSDEVCRAEYRRLLGSLGGGGHKALVEDLETTYWILRAARVTHPTVKNAGERMKGEGFEDVADEDRKVFCRGDGWDGAGSGEMEIEGFNDS